MKVKSPSPAAAFAMSIFALAVSLWAYDTSVGIVNEGMERARNLAKHDLLEDHVTNPSIILEGSYLTRFSCVAKSDDLGKFEASDASPSKACALAAGLLKHRHKELLLPTLN